MLYFFVDNIKKAEGLEVLGGGEGSGFALTIYSKGTYLATFADPFNSTIYNHSSIIMRAATTKIPHLLYEKDLLKTPIEMCDFIYNDLYDGDERKTPKYTKIQEQKQRKKFPVWLSSHPPSRIAMPLNI